MASSNNISDGTRLQSWESHMTSADTGEITTSRHCPPLTTFSTVMASPSTAVVHSVASVNCTITSPSSSVASSSKHASASYKRRSPIKLVSVEDHQNYCCGHWFPSNKSYTKHLAEKAKSDLVHEMRLIERGMVQCSECKTWLQMESLNAHLRKMHGIIKLGGKGGKGVGGPLPDTSRQQSKTMSDLLSENKSVASSPVQNGLPGYVIKVNGKSLVKSIVSSSDKVKTVSSNNNEMLKKLKINHGPGKGRLVIQGGTRKLSGNGIASRILMPSGQPSRSMSPIGVSRVGSPVLSSASVISPTSLTTSVPPLLGSDNGSESGLDGNKIIYSGSLIRSENEDVSRVLTPSSYSSVTNSIISLPENGMQVVKKKIVKARKISCGNSSESLVSVSERKSDSGKKGGGGGTGNVGRPRKSRKQVLTPQNSTTESSVVNESVSNVISPGLSDDNLSIRPGVMTSTPVTSRKRKKKKGKDGLDPNAPRYTKAGKLMKKRGRPRKNPLPPALEKVPEFDPDVENEPVIPGPTKEEEENIPTVELDLFTLPSANEESSVLFLTDPKNPNFKVYANTDAIFVGDSSAALGDVTNQIGYVTDTNNVVYVNPSHFLFPNVKDLENFVPYPILTAKGPKLMAKKINVNAPTDSAVTVPKISIPSPPCKDMFSVTNTTESNVVRDIVKPKTCESSVSFSSDKKLDSCSTKLNESISETPSHSLFNSSVGTNINASENKVIEDQVTASSLVKSEDSLGLDLLKEEVKKQESVEHNQSSQNNDGLEVSTVDTELTSSEDQRTEESETLKNENEGETKEESTSEENVSDVSEKLSPEVQENSGEIRSEKNKEFTSIENEESEDSSVTVDKSKSVGSQEKRNKDKSLSESETDNGECVVKMSDDKEKDKLKDLENPEKDELQVESRTENDGGIESERNATSKLTNPVFTRLRRGRSRSSHVDLEFNKPSSLSTVLRKRSRSLSTTNKEIQENSKLQKEWGSQMGSTDVSISVAKKLSDDNLETCTDTPTCEEQPSTHGSDTILEHNAMEDVAADEKETHQVPSLKSLAGQASRGEEVTVTEAPNEGSDELETCDTRSTSETDVASDTEFTAADEEDTDLLPSGKQRLSIRKLEDIQDLNISSIKGPFNDAEQSHESLVCSSSICGDEASDVSHAEAGTTSGISVEGERRADSYPDSEQPLSSSETDKSAPVNVSELVTTLDRAWSNAQYSPSTYSEPCHSPEDDSEQANELHSGGVQAEMLEDAVSSDILSEPSTCKGDTSNQTDTPSENSTSYLEVSRNKPPTNILKTRIEIPLNIANGLMTKGSVKKEGKKEKKKKKSPKKDLEDQTYQKSDKKRTKKRRKSSSSEKISVLEVHPLSPKQEVPRLKQMKIDKILLQREGKNVYKVAKSPEKKEVDMAERSEVEGISARKRLDMDDRSPIALVENESSVPVKIKKKRLIQKFSKDKAPHKLGSEDFMLGAQSFSANEFPSHKPRLVRERRPSSRLIESIQNSRTDERTHSLKSSSLVPHEMSSSGITTAVVNEPHMQALAPGEVISVMRAGPISGLVVQDVFTNSLKPQENLPAQKRKRGRPRKRLEVVELKEDDDVRQELELSPTREWRGRGAKLKAQVLIQDQQAGVIDSQVVPVSPIASPGGSGSGSPGASSIDQSLSPSKRESMEREWQARGAKLKAQVMITDQQQGVSDVKVFPCVSPASVTQVPSLNITVTPSPDTRPTHTPVPKKTKYDVSSPKNRDIRSFFVKKSPVSANSEEGESSSLKLTLAHRGPSKNKRIRRYDAPPVTETEPFPQKSCNKQEKPKRVRSRVTKPVKRLRHPLFTVKSPSRKSVKTVIELRNMLMERERALNRAIPSAELFILTKDFDGFEMTSRQSGLRSKTLMRMMSLLQNKTYYNADRFAMPLECLFDWNDETLTKVLFPDTFGKYK
ncbi:uncharacterized protein LOC143020474 [Oratosquilla oratoria]|uniref:uncharacterized protein LOC143020474 n=1 Tax=Oratosquilla oratoria TaxID=337810 RepID=UPI003F775167